jgi:hypothetical protein
MPAYIVRMHVLMMALKRIAATTSRPGWHCNRALSNFRPPVELPRSAPFSRAPVWRLSTGAIPRPLLVAEKSLIAGFHYPFPSLGHIEKGGNELPARTDRLEHGDLGKSQLAWRTRVLINRVNVSPA